MKTIKGKVKTLDLSKNCEKYAVEADDQEINLNSDFAIDIDPPISLTKKKLTLITKLKRRNK